MNDLKIREAAVADIPQMCSIFQNDLGYTECTQEIVGDYRSCFLDSIFITLQVSTSRIKKAGSSMENIPL